MLSICSHNCLSTNLRSFRALTNITSPSSAVVSWTQLQVWALHRVGVAEVHEPP